MKRLVILALLASAASATDFSQMSIEQMINMRGRIPVAEHSAFRDEMRKRIQNMSPSEHQEFMQLRGKRQGMGQRKGMSNKPSFADYDTNNDGIIAEKEFNDARTKRMTERAKAAKMMKNAENAPPFTDIDLNNDGSISEDEFTMYQTKQMQKQKRNR